MDVKGMLFTRKCACCGAYLTAGNASRFSDVCSVCEEKIVLVQPPYCERCFRGKDSCRCYNERPHAYDGAISPFYYEGSIRDAIMRMKFSGKESVARFLGRELGAEVVLRYFGIPFDVVTCVPATLAAISERGFNQSRSIAENLALSRFGMADIGFDYNLLVKRQQTAVQHRLGAKGRYVNSEMAYSLNSGRSVDNKVILLIDDIITTGATADECARTLKLAGASRVYLATAAMTRFEKN